MAAPNSRHSAERERFVEDLLDFMTLEEKLGQLVMLPTSTPGRDAETIREDRSLIDQLRRGHLGGFIGEARVSDRAELQRIAIEETRLGIPLFFAGTGGRGAADVMPSSASLAASWDVEVNRAAQAIVAQQMRESGLNWLLDPEVTLATPQGGGEYLHSLGSSAHLAQVLSSARIQGIQSGDGNEPTMLACLRLDDVSWLNRRNERRLPERLQIAFECLRDTTPGSISLAAAQRSFDVSGSRSDPILALGRPGGYEGIDLAEWAELAKLSGRTRADFGFVGLSVPALAEAIDRGKIDAIRVEDAVRRVLAAKFDMQMFRAGGPATQRPAQTRASHQKRSAAMDIARRSIVLLRNDRSLLPLGADSRELLVVGTAAQDRIVPVGEGKSPAISLIDGLEALGVAHKYVPGLAIRHTDGDPRPDRMIEADRMAIGMAGEAARRSRTVIVALGEIDSIGEAHRTLLETLRAMSDRIILVTLGARPFDPEIAGEVLPCVLHAGHLGSVSGHAIAEVLTGEFAPVGRLPAPLIESGRTLLPFGHGLGFAEFGLTDAKVELGVDRVLASAVLHNLDQREGSEIVQFYIRRPRGDGLELVAFQQVSLVGGESRRLLFEAGTKELGGFDESGAHRVEAGAYEFALGLSEERAIARSLSVPQAVIDAMASARKGDYGPGIFGDFSAAMVLRR